jgi:hypothetical protein
VNPFESVKANCVIDLLLPQQYDTLILKPKVPYIFFDEIFLSPIKRKANSVENTSVPGLLLKYLLEPFHELVTRFSL